MNMIEKVEELKKLEAKATPVGWVKSTKAEYEEDGPTGHDEYNLDEGIVRADGDGWGQIVCRPDLERDADFIADMRNAAPDTHYLGRSPMRVEMVEALVEAESK